jgi:hypothetical protein
MLKFVIHAVRAAIPSGGFDLYVDAQVGRLLLPKESGGNITHVSLLQFMKLTIIPVDAHKNKGIDNSINIEAHIYEAINEVFVVSLVPGGDENCSVSQSCSLVLQGHGGWPVLSRDIISPMCIVCSWCVFVLVLAQVEHLFRCAGIPHRPILSNAGKLFGLLHKHTRNFGVLGVFGVGNFEEHADG